MWKTCKKHSYLQSSSKMVNFQKIHVKSSVMESHSHLVDYPRDIEILGWCRMGPVLPNMGECASLVLVGHPYNDDFTIKMPYGVNVLLHQPTSHPIFSY